METDKFGFCNVFFYVTENNNQVFSVTQNESLIKFNVCSLMYK